MAWPVVVALIVARDFTFGGGTWLAISIAMAIGPGLVLSAYVLARPRHHVVVARLVSIPCSLPVAFATSHRTTTYDCQIDPFCGFEYATVPVAEWFVYGVVVALYTSGMMERCGGSRLLRRKPSKPAPPED